MLCTSCPVSCVEMSMECNLQAEDAASAPMGGNGGESQSADCSRSDWLNLREATFSLVNRSSYTTGLSQNPNVQLLEGLRMATYGSMLSLREETVKRRMKKATWSLLLIGLGVALIGYVVIFPFWFLTVITSTILRTLHLPDFGLGDATFHMFEMLGSMVHLGPVVALSVVKICFPGMLDDLFFKMLYIVDPENAKRLKDARTPGFGKSLSRFGRRMGRYLLYASLYAFASLFLGSMTRSVFKFILVCNLFGPGFGFVCAFFALFPFSEPLVTAVVEYRLLSRSMTREILDPYFRRMHLKSKEEGAFLSQNQYALFSFSVPFLLLMKLPFIGVLFWGFAQCAIVVFLVDSEAPMPGQRQSARVSRDEKDVLPAESPPVRKKDSTETGRGRLEEDEEEVDSLRVNGIDFNALSLVILSVLFLVLKFIIKVAISFVSKKSNNTAYRRR